MFLCKLTPDISFYNPNSVVSLFYTIYGNKIKTVNYKINMPAHPWTMTDCVVAIFISD